MVLKGSKKGMTVKGMVAKKVPAPSRKMKPTQRMYA